MAFRKGAEEADKASQFASFARTHFLKIDDGKSAILRFLTDAPGWIVVDMHQNIPTKPKPSDYKGENWPTAMPAVCRYDKNNGVRTFPDLDGCFICDVLTKQNSKIKKPTGRVWALAVIREAVIGDGSDELGGPAMQGKTLGYRDATRTVKKTDAEGKPTDEEVEEKAIIVVNQGNKNFFSPLSGFANFHGTVLDRDYVVQRKGTGTATDYNLINLEPITLPDGRPFDLRDPKLFEERYGMTPDAANAMLEDIVSQRASDDYYGQWFDPSKSSSSGTAAASANNVPDQSGEPDEDAMQALKDRIEGYKPDGATDAAAAPAAAQEAPAPGAAPAAGGMRSYD